MRAVALLFGGVTERAWGELLFSVASGEPAFHRVFGKDSFAYFAEHAEEAANFDAAMSTFTAPIAAVVAATYDFAGVRHVVDVGGGNGALLFAPTRPRPQDPSAAEGDAVRPARRRRAGAAASEGARP